MTQLHTRVLVDGTWYGPGPVPDEVAARITNPNVWGGKPPAAGGLVHDDQALVAELDVLRLRAEAAEQRADAAEAEVARLTAELEHLQGASDQSATEADWRDETPVATTSIPEPPRGGPGSGERVWREFLAGQGIEAPATASREDLHSLWDQRKPS